MTPPPLAMRLAKLGGAVVILALIGVLLVFGDSILGDGGDGEGGDPPAGESGPEQSDKQQDRLRPAVTGAATEVLETWARPDAPYQSWWKRLRPLLTPGAQEAYAFTDTAQLPELGGLKPTDTTMHGLGGQATVYFDTDAGEYGVDLSRKDGQWLANRVIFPGGESMFG